MKYLIYISHPAQFHFFKHTVHTLIKQGHELKLLIKSKDILEKLLIEEGFKYENILQEGRGDGFINTLIALIKRDIRLLKITNRFKPDIMLGTDASIAHVGFIKRIPTISVTEDDYEITKKLCKLTYPFTKHIFTPTVCGVGRWDKKKIAYDGYMKLAYLHPEYFTPDLKKLKIDHELNYFIIRLARLKAYHDKGISGIDIDLLDEMIQRLEKKGKVYITSEYKLDSKYDKYLLSIPLQDIHHYMAFSSLLISESQSMSVEASLLGIPSIRISSFTGRISVLEELEHKYNLTYAFKPDHKEKILLKLDEMLDDKSLSDNWKIKQKKLLLDKINVTKYLLWILNTYPQSYHQISVDKNTQKNFK